MSVIGIDASRALSATPTGIEAYSWYLIDALVPLLRADQHTIHLYFRTAPRRVPGDRFVQGSPGDVVARVLRFPRLWTHIRLSYEMGRFPPDLLFVPAHVLPLIHPHRTLVTIHDLGYRFFPRTHPAAQRYYLELGTRWNARRATHIIVNSYATRDAVVATYGVPADRITVIYPGYHSDLVPVHDPHVLERTCRRYHIPDKYVLFLGRIQPRKNLKRLIEAFGYVAGECPDLSLVLAGPQGWLTTSIKEQVHHLGLEERVLFPGFIAAEDKAALISGAQVFAYPSLYEGFGFPVLEAQACGTPLMTSTTSSLPEVAGRGALYVDPLDTESIAEGLRRLLNDQVLRQELIAQGFENSRRFSWATTAQQVRDVITMLLSQ